MAEMTCPLCGRKMKMHKGDWTCFDCDFVWMGEGRVYPDTFDEWAELMQPDYPRDLAKRDGKYVQRKLKLVGGGVGSFAPLGGHACSDCGHDMRRGWDFWYCPNCGAMKHYRRAKPPRTREGVALDA